MDAFVTSPPIAVAATVVDGFSAPVVIIFDWVEEWPQSSADRWPVGAGVGWGSSSSDVSWPQTNDPDGWVPGWRNRF